MSMDQVLETIRCLDGALELAPTVGSTFHEISWGDHFFYYAPDGRLPHRDQPFATIVTKNYPDDTACDLDDPGRWRLNIHVGSRVFLELTGEEPRADGGGWDYAVVDQVVPHPVYRAEGWVSIINPGLRTHDLAIRLLRQAHASARRRAARRRRSRPPHLS